MMLQHTLKYQKTLDLCLPQPTTRLRRSSKHKCIQISINSEAAAKQAFSIANSETALLAQANTALTLLIRDLITQQEASPEDGND